MNRPLLGLSVCAMLLAMGCTSPIFEGSIFEPQPKADPEVARVVTNTQQMSMEFRQLSEQMMVLNRNQELIEARLVKLEEQLVSPGAPQDEVASLRREIQALRVERESLRKEITDDLAGRIEKIAARQQTEINAARTAVSRAGSGGTSSRPAATAAARSGYEHKVERGQTLSEIARGYGKSLDVIMKANKISDPSMLRAGQILFIPD